MSQLITGLNSVSSFSGVPSGLGSLSVTASVGETGVFVYGTNIQVYLADSGVGTWADSGASFSATDHEGILISWSGKDRMYIRDLSGSTPSVHAHPRSGSTSIPTLSAFISSIEGLSDVPDYDSDEGGKYLAVNSGGTAIEFVDAPSGGGSVTYSTSAEFVLNYAEVSGATGSLEMNDTNAKDSGGSYYTYTDPDTSSTVTGAAISIPSSSRVVGMVWRIIDKFITSSGNASLNGLISFGDEGVYFPIQGGYNYTSYSESNIYSISSGSTYKIITPGTYDWTSVGSSSNDALTVFTADANDYSYPSSTSVAYQQNTSFGFESGSSTQVFNLGDGDDLKMISGGINHVPDVSGAFAPKIHWSAYSEQTLTAGVIGVKFIYI